MEIKAFQTERFFARYEFSTPQQLCASDCQTMTVAELLQLAGESAESLGRLTLGYTPTEGAAALRERIAALYQRFAPGQVLVLGAPEEGIFLAMHALLSPGDEVVVLTPCYDSLANLPEHLGCKVERWPLLEPDDSEGGPPGSDGGWRVDLGRLASMLSPRTRLLVVNFPHNPTGCLPSQAQWRELIALAERNGTWLFSDEMYRGLEQEPADRLPPACELYDRAISLGGLSKTYGLPGLRCGWLAVRDAQARRRIIQWKDYTTICSAAPSEFLAEAALRVAEPLAERSRRIIRANLAVADGFFASWPSVFRWRRPRAGSVALVELRAGRAEQFVDRLVREAGVLLLPGACLGADDRYVRFGFGRLEFPAALGLLDQYLHKPPATPANGPP